MIFEITEEGTGHVAALLQVGGRQAANTRAVMDRIVLDMLRVEGVTFRAQGRRGGGSWAGLKPDTVRKRGGSTEILRTNAVRPGYAKFGPDALFKSLTEMGAPYQILEVTRDTIVFGTDRPFAEVHQYGNARTPARPFMRFLPTDQARWLDLITEHLMKPFLADEATEI